MKVLVTMHLCAINNTFIAKSYEGLDITMKRMFGFILFWIAIGMTIMLFITSGLLAIFLIIFCLVLGYNLFTC